jgi:hypothetical protein
MSHKGGHGGDRLGSGRPSAAFNTKDSPPSRQKFQCPICGTERRSDKLSVHMTQLCHFTKDGNPCNPDDESLKNLSKEAKQHTEYCFRKNITRDTLINSWKRLSPVGTEFLSPFQRAMAAKKNPSSAVRQVNFNLNIMTLVYRVRKAKKTF